MDKLSRQSIVTASTALLVLLAGCGGGSGSAPADATGRVSLGVSDGPISGASKVCIEFNEVELKGEGPSTTIALDEPAKVNLLSFQGQNAFPLLFNDEIPAGEYQWMRLGVNAVRGANGGVDDVPGTDACEGEASYISMEGGLYNLYVPSGANSGLKLVGGFTVPVNGSADFTAEIDLKKSIADPVGLPDVILRPTIRLVNNVDVGTLTGQVGNDLATAIVPETETACDPWVYVYDDFTESHDIGAEDMSVASAMVKSSENNEGITEYHYTVGFLLTSDYEVAFSCDDATFEPAGGKPATITAQSVTIVDFFSTGE
jgi:hypothetical protein